MQQHQQLATGIIRVMMTTVVGLVIVLSLLFTLKLGALAADVNRHHANVTPPNAIQSPESPTADCSTLANVPKSECITLVALYTQTNGTEWISNTKWLQFDSAAAPCDWYGVSCSGGHVTELILPHNALSGTLPLALGNLVALTRLRLEKNALQGRIPPTICELAHLTDLSLAYNAFFTLRQSVERCLEPLQSDWLATQTTTVEDLRITEILTNELRLEWEPISYTAGGGYYEIAIAPTFEGPFVVHGHTADKSASTYAITDLEPSHTYFILVRAYTPPHDDQLSHVRSIASRTVGVTRALSGRVLVAAYFPADNDLATEIPYVVERFRLGTDYNPNVQVVLLVDGRGDGDTRLLEIANGDVTITSVVMDAWGVNELDTADPAVLAWFLKYARNTFPSERNVATIIGHGIALAPEVDWPPSPDDQATQASPARAAGEIPPLPKEHDYTPSDVTNRGYLSAVDVGQALLEATEMGTKPFDILFFDQCFQGNLDVLYEVRNTATIYIASPNYAWLAAAYNKYLTRFTPLSTPEEMALAILDFYRLSLDPHHPNAIFAIRNVDLLDMADTISDLGDALLAALAAGEQEKIAQAVRDSQYVDTTQCGNHNLELGPPDELIGIESLSAGLQLAFGDGDPYGVDAALDQLAILDANIQKRTIIGHPYIAPEQLWAYGNSLTVLAPLPRNSPPAVVWRASLYRDDVPFAARWSLDPTQPVTVTASLAFVRDGRWDEFLDAWYSNLAPTVGQWCNYIPPQQVVVVESERLTLTATALSTDSLQLDWTPSDDSSATEYWLYARPSYAVGWLVEQIVPIGQNNVILSNLDAGEYSYGLLARSEDQGFIAQSNPVTVTITGPLTPTPITPTATSPLRLPLVMGD